jgi:hypothetical protein
MAQLESRPTVKLDIVIRLTEEEAGALAGYGVEEFIKVFYEHLGKAYLEPYEKGLRSLFKSVRGSDAGALGLSSYLQRAKTARNTFRDEERP